MGEKSTSIVRCERCGGPKVLAKCIHVIGPAALYCPKCDDTDPFELPASARWIDSELRPPK